jgi:hypothetical protein
LAYAQLCRDVPVPRFFLRTSLPLSLRQCVPLLHPGCGTTWQGSIRTASAVGRFSRKEPVMSKKGNKTKGNKEIKKPKQEKPKVLATANSGAGKANLTVGGKSVK